ncbi:hypothetical protein C7999DRAFT_43665 [Corynascus novoguineensis]|uniref:NYN domain-containing protein n=1 Tax=Corynascus novoguineensis TaxID=1126955 RepID=A0AAN7HLY2_9PEZI|nr:hypothetical protein C7999DRAFT_43665 [Corynascus novoguineensis]
MLKLSVCGSWLAAVNVYGRPHGKIFIYIDNSNLWIQGQRTYAEKKILKVSWDPTWRFDIGHLRDILLAHSDLKAEEKTSEVKVNLYGSIPPPVDTVWKVIESHDVRVITFKRSSWNQREKQVDAELIADSSTQAVEAYYKQVPAVFIIVSGDRDVRSAVVKITEHGCPVHLWSWDNGLAKVFREDDDEIAQNLFKVHSLDDHLEEVGFHTRTWRIDRAAFIDKHSIVVLDPLPKAPEVENFINRLRTPVYQYEFLPKRTDATSQDLAIIPAHAFAMSSAEKRDLFHKSKAELEKRGLSVLSYLDYDQKYLKGSKTDNSLGLSNRFHELPVYREVEDDGDASEAEDDSGGGKAERDTRLKKKEEYSGVRCYWRIYCERGLGCKYGHTKAEQEHFSVYGNRKAKKYKLCARPDCIRGRNCFYAHGDWELFCPTCGKTGGHEMSLCKERFSKQ